MQSREKKMNKLFLDFIIGGSFLGDRAQELNEKIKKIVVDAYDHLMIQWGKVKKWWEED